jgi:hypothetical protein
VRREAFFEAGCYPEWPLLEDVDLVKRLRHKFGAPAVIPQPLKASGRRWEKFGLLRVTAMNQLILLRHALGEDAFTLAEEYYRSSA